VNVQKYCLKHMVPTMTRGTTIHSRCHEFVSLLQEIFGDNDYDAFIVCKTQFEGFMRVFFGNLIENDDD
jgi:hypothetical protein